MRVWFVVLVIASCRWDFDLHSRPIDAAPDAVRMTGCADGTREAFVDQTMFPTIAGCSASWAVSMDLRRATTGATCGNSLGVCALPADACAVGWHLCGLSGDPTEVSMRVSGSECAAQLGAYVLATGHCSNNDSGCVYDTPLPCLDADVDCSEPVCCGTGCNSTNTCMDGIFEGTTTIAGINGNGPGNYCGDFDSSLVDGVLCCD